LLSPVMLPWVLGLNMSVYATAQTALWRLLWIFGLLLLSNPFFALLMGIQKVHLTHLIGTFSLLCELIGILVLVPFGLTMSRVVFVYAAGAILSTLLSIFLVRRHFPKPGLKLVSVSRLTILDLVHYTRRWSVTVSSTLLPPVIDKLILARFVGLSYVALYEAAAKLVEILKRATQLLLLPLFPLAGAVVPNQSEEETQALYRRVFGANLAFNAGLYLIPAALTFGIMSIWLGPEVSGVAGVAFGVLAITQFLLALVFPGVLILAGIGRMGLLVTAGVTAMSLNIFLSPVLTRYFGFHGLLAGTVLSYGGQSLLILIGLQRRKEFALDLGAVLPTAVALAGAAAVPALVLTRVFGQATGGAKLAAFGAVSIVLYCLVLFAFRENRKLAAVIVAHSRKMIETWRVGGKRGAETQA
jgi:O-antigen/teichoic acid export membrane protein